MTLPQYLINVYHGARVDLFWKETKDEALAAIDAAWKQDGVDLVTCHGPDMAGVAYPWNDAEASLLRTWAAMKAAEEMPTPAMIEAVKMHANLVAARRAARPTPYYG